MTARSLYPADVFDRIARAVIEDDPAGHALYWGAVADEDGRAVDDITDRPKHWLAVTVARGLDALGPRKRSRAVDAAHEWLTGVADGPLLPLGTQPGRWLYLMDVDGLNHIDRRRLRVNLGFSQRVYLDTGVVSFLPWRTPGAILADAYDAHQRALAFRERGRGCFRLHASAAELAELDLAPRTAPAPDPLPIFRPFATAA